MYLSRLLLCMAVMLMIMPGQADAIEFEPSLGIGWWQYEESLTAIPGNAASPLDSKAHGWGLVPALAFSQDMGAGVGTISVRGLVPFASTDERWVLPGSIQNNRLNVRELDSTVSFMYTWRNVQFGGWADYLWHEQKRKAFFVNGTRKVVAGEPVRELVRSSWVGIKGTYEGLLSRLILRASAGWPVYVRVTNTNIANTAFSHVSGYRWGIGGSWSISGGMEKVQIALSISYQLRYLAGESPEQTPSWPTNRWQSANAGVSVRW